MYILRDVASMLVLWDVDHTLIENGGVSRAAYEQAFRSLTGQSLTHAVETDGRTDPLIMEDLLIRHGLQALDPAQLEAALVEALDSRSVELAERGYALPGAAAVLAALQRRRDVIQSVLTGNIRPNAVLKLATFGLDRFVDFEVGGYGSDDAARARLVGVAQRRAQAKFGTTFRKENTVLIGDTPRDVRAGLDGGARVVAVATGASSAKELRAAGADVVLDDLTLTTTVVSAVLGIDISSIATPVSLPRDPEKPAV